MLPWMYLNAVKQTIIYGCYNQQLPNGHVKIWPSMFKCNFIFECVMAYNELSDLLLGTKFNKIVNLSWYLGQVAFVT